MKNRDAEIFTTIVREYIKNAIPVSSQMVLDANKNLGVSSATVRNVMVSLEDDGMIMQPHTSAGRVPTEKGYRIYIEKHLREKKLAKKYVESLNQLLEQADAEYRLKFIAKGLAEISGLLVFVAFGPRDIYYTGLSQLLVQPEFSQYDRVYDISKVVDQLDEVVHQVFHEVSGAVRILIGAENPFGQDSSSILASYGGTRQSGIFGLIGPMRMDYDANVSLIKYAQEVLSNI